MLYAHLAFLTFSFWLFALPRADAASYSFTNFDIPGAFSTRISGINDRGDVVGNYEDRLGFHGFIFDGKAVITIDFPESLGTSASAISNKGEVVGSFTDSDFRSHGFIYDRGQFTVIDAPFADAGDTLLGGINNRGQIVGESLFIDAPTAELSNEQGFLYDDQQFQVIPITRPTGINNRGDIVGVIPGSEFGFIYARGVLAQVLFPGSTETTVLGINNKGDIVGTYQMAGEERRIHGFVYAKGVFSTLDAPFADVSYTFPVSINNKGDIVGEYFIGETVRSFIARPDSRGRRKLSAR